MPSFPPLRFAVVGLKGYSLTHLRLVHMLSEGGTGQLVASFAIDKEEHPEIVSDLESRGVRIFGDYHEMLETCRGQLDVVTLPVPIYLHVPMAIDALRAGYHVFLEKPVAGSTTEVDQLIKVRDATGKQVAVGFQQIYSPVFQTLKRYVVSGKLGVVKRISIMALWPRGPAYYARNNWAGKLFCDGRAVYDSPFGNALAHQITNMLYLASPDPDRAAYLTSVEAELYRAYDIESFDTGCMRGKTNTGTEVVFATTHACLENVDPVMRLEATKARVDWHIRGNAEIAYADGTTETVEEDLPRKYMMQSIVDAVNGVIPHPICTPEIGRAHVACIEAIHRTTEIQTVPDKFLSTTTEGQKSISGVENAVQQTFGSGQLFSEQNAAFAISC